MSELMPSGFCLRDRLWRGAQQGLAFGSGTQTVQRLGDGVPGAGRARGDKRLGRGVGRWLKCGDLGW